ncbi:NrfD/PsrC family molybdoenzyme membrane anchor subunit [Azospirillum halopraeferens]|uniref:NrfD/PsrC family molybdoenzyme membrane anchor subunit n=1 Tax=Azospirillum halopraeferens TaxID=34010 RepID=UPI00146FB191|nr:NrfD/PsrC family molybdoenzyme membrane anchor subunit [Azospirillum halopraeferens]
MRGPTVTDDAAIGYYGVPPVKASPFDWKIAAYVQIGGVAGAAQVLSAVAAAAGGRRARGVVRHGRWMALAGAVLGPPFLIADLKTPTRWYNMLRIARPTSPMSVGSYILTGFGAFSALAALPAGRLSDAAQVPAALLGAGMATYTASLLSATSSPFWAEAPRSLAVQFACSSVAGAAAALSLAEQAAGRPGTAATLDAITAAAAAGELAASIASGHDHKEPAVAGALALGVAVPLACHAANRLSRRPSRTLSVIGALAALAGGALLRHAVIQAGNRSTERPRDTFRLTRPPEPARLPPRR